MENEVVVFISQVKKSKANKTVERIHRKKTKSRLDARHTSPVRVVTPSPPPVKCLWTCVRRRPHHRGFGVTCVHLSLPFAFFRKEY